MKVTSVSPIPTSKPKGFNRFSPNGDSFFLLLIGPPFLILFLLTAGPLLYALFISLLNWNLAVPNSKFIALENFARMMSDGNFWNSVALTLYQVGVTVIGQLVLGMMMALLLYRQFKGVKLLRSLYLIPMMTTPIVVGLVWRMLFNTDMGFINYFLSLINIQEPNWLGDPLYAMPAVIITDWWLSTPFVAIILLAGLQSISQEPYEAARIDGANNFQIFWYITLPLLKPIIWLALLFRIMDAIKRFDTIYVMTAGGPGNSTETLNLHAYFHAFQFLNIGYSSALSSLMFIIILLLSFFILRNIRKSQL